MQHVYPGAAVMPSPSAFSDRRGCESWPLTLVVHGTQAGGGTGRDVARDFANSSAKCTHFVIDKDGWVSQHCDPVTQAAAGNGFCTSTSGYWDRNTNGNFYTVSIEIFKIDNGEKPTEAQYRVLGELSRWICDLCHIPKKWCDSKAGGITSHGFFDPVHRSNVNGPGGDPGTFDWNRYFASLSQVKEQPWYMYPVGVPFGNPNYDAGLGGSHDMTVLAPPNAPVTSLVSGVVSDLSAPEWGKQVGIHLDSPINGIPWFHYLHLSAINPALALGSHVNVGDLVGWVGGGNDEDDYAGTNNPTGKNFCNTTYMSSRIQVGIALMRGPAYGGAGWQTFPPIDWTLDPTPLLEEAKKGFLMQFPPTNKNTWVIERWESFFRAIGHPEQTPPRDTGIFNTWRSYLLQGVDLGGVTSGESTKVDPNMLIQYFTAGQILHSKVDNSEIVLSASGRVQ